MTILVHILEFNVLGKRIDPSRKRYVCDKCHECFFIRDEYRNHRRVSHPKLRFWTCGICNKFSENYRWLPKHIESVHGKKKRISCFVCGLKFDEQQVYEEHKKIHVGEKRFKCDICQQAFGSQQGKQRHFRVVHVKETLYKCKFCNLLTCSQEKLKAHISIHTGERSVTCDECGKCFITKSHLKHHQLCKHSEKAKNMRCDICGMRLSSLISTIKHMRLHIDDVSKNSYSCSFCSKCYKTKCGKQKHELLKHGLQPYKCLLCEKGFVTRKDLARHQTLCDQEEPNQ